MIVIIKNVAGCDYPFYDSQGKRLKTISLKGGCFMNEIMQDDYNLLIKEYPSFKEAIDKGYIIVNDTKDKKLESKAVDDTLQEGLDKQEKSLKDKKIKIKKL